MPTGGVIMPSSPSSTTNTPNQSGLTSIADRVGRRIGIVSSIIDSVSKNMPMKR